MPIYRYPVQTRAYSCKNGRAQGIEWRWRDDYDPANVGPGTEETQVVLIPGTTKELSIAGRWRLAGKH
jgi:hypothetical protein